MAFIAQAKGSYIIHELTRLGVELDIDPECNEQMNTAYKLVSHAEDNFYIVQASQTHHSAQHPI